MTEAARTTEEPILPAGRGPGERPEPEEPRSAAGADGARHPSAMQERFNWLFGAIANRLFKHVVMNEQGVRRIRRLAEQGTVIYALRYRSIIDYFLLNYVLRREGLELPVFANGVSTTSMGPFRETIARLRSRIGLWLRGRSARIGAHDHDYCADAVRSGRPIVVFMRGHRSRGKVGRWFGAGSMTRVGSDYLREIVRVNRETGNEHFIIPIAMFRGHSFRRRGTRLTQLVYSVQDVPSDTRKAIGYWWNRKDLFITVGTEVSLQEQARHYPGDSEPDMVRRIHRQVQIFLQREERVVLGPGLLPRKRVKAFVLKSSQVESTIERLHDEQGIPLAKLRKRADKYFEEMASDFNGIRFAVVAYVFKKIWARMFSGLVWFGFDKVVDKVRKHPVVLVPCHRSHFDYLILTYLCHLNFVSPPHIAAGVNLAFWPMAPLLRASGAYFIRRSFGDNELYKAVFNQYLAFLIREGYTQEFFIEGGRSRTGKIMTPKLGMLTSLVNAYLTGIRRDLYLCPVSIHYGRIVEEDAYQFELTGGEKEAESIGGLLRARRFLKQKYGTVYLSFAEPISLREALGEDRPRFAADADDPEVEEEQRRFIQRLGFKILRDVNECTVAGATSISATVLLGAPHGGITYENYRAEANALADFVEHRKIQPTGSLERNRGDFRESLEFLDSSGLIDVLRRGDEEILVIGENKRLALDFYKNNLIHVFLIPSLVTFALVVGKSREELAPEVEWWLDLFRWEFALPPKDELQGLIDDTVSYLEDVGALTDDGIDTEHPLTRASIAALDDFREAYWMAARSVLDRLGEEGLTDKQLTDEYRNAFKIGLLLGEVFQAEGGSTQLLTNALKRYVEMGFIRSEQSGRSRKEKRYFRGDSFDELATFVDGLSKGMKLGHRV